MAGLAAQRLNSASGEAARWNVKLEGFATVNWKKRSKMEWIDVANELPKSGAPVLVACRTKVLRAVHAGKFALDEENWGWFNDGDGGDYNEADDTTYWPEGWYEWNEFEETHWALDVEPTHWMPLPAPPSNVADKRHGTVLRDGSV